MKHIFITINNPSTFETKRKHMLCRVKALNHILRKGAFNLFYMQGQQKMYQLNLTQLFALYQKQVKLPDPVEDSPFPALPTARLYVGSPPCDFVRMSIVQSPSIARLSLITEHFFLPSSNPWVNKLSRSFDISFSISSV